jgi:glycosyltransferase involved in cell wall biosynthesis
MRIAQITPRYFPNIGGVEILVKELSEHLTEKGHEVIVCSLDLSKKLQEKSHINRVLVRRYYTPIKDPLFLPPLKLLSFLRNETFDVVHIHNIHTLLPLGVTLLSKRNQPFVLQPHYHRYGQTTVRNTLFRLQKILINKLIIPKIDFVIANSYYEKTILQEDFPKCKTKIVHIPQAILTDDLKTLKWTPHANRILYVGALRRYKNVDKLLEAFSLIISSTTEKPTLVIVGEGKEKKRLIQLAEKLGVNEYVEWKKNLTRTQLLAEYSKARLFISLSTLESFARTVNEAIAIGLPTIVLDSGIATDLIKKGLVRSVSSTNPNEVAEVILKALQEETPSRQKKRILHLTSWNEYTEKILTIYKNLKA